MNLDKIRTCVDKIDSEILRLLNKRMEFAIRTKFFKSDIADLSRESKIFESVKSQSRWLVDPQFSEKLFGQILDESKRLQTLDINLVGFQGEHGAMSEMAIGKLNEKKSSKYISIPCSEYAEILEGVKTSALNFGVVPIEHSLEGGVSQVNDLLVESDLYIIGEIYLPVHYCFLALKETDYRDIKVVYSHPQSLGHCRGFISRNKLEARPYHDTAGAALMLVKDRPTASGVIAGRLAAELYGLEVLMDEIEDHKAMNARYAVLAKEPKKDGGSKTSIVFSAKHAAGSLHGILQLFATDGINLTRIESRPLKKDPGQFVFLLDFEANSNDEKIKKLLQKVEEQAQFYKFLGSYNKE